MSLVHAHCIRVVWLLGVCGFLSAWNGYGRSVRADDANEPVFSGPQVDEKLPPLKAIGVYGEQAGKELTIVGEAAERPMVIVFFHERTRPAFALTNQLMRYVGSRDDLNGAVVYLTADRTATEKWLNVVKQHIPSGVAVAVSADGQEGPGAYGLNRHVALTVLVAKENTVTANFALVQPSVQADLPKIAKAIVEAAGGELPNLERLTGDRPAMRRENPEAFNPRETLGPLIRKDAPEKEIREAAERVESLAKTNAAARQQIGEIARRIVDAGKLENYGTAVTQEYLKKWAREFR
ncbi:MAG: hypothetical protein R3C99_09460 [Pirellulaceae bacterium]